MNVDSEKIRDVLHKLTGNAVSYTDDGGHVDVTINKVGEKVRFEVKDTGIGIPRQEAGHIFQRFFRASNASTMVADASGLELYISKHYVEEHGGEIGFDSKEGEGSTFWIELPIGGVS